MSPPTRSSTFPRPPPQPQPGIGRSTTTYSLTPRSAPTGVIPANDAFTYHTTAAPINPAFSPPSTTARASAENAVRALVAVEESRPERSKRFLSSRLWLSSHAVADGHTFLTFSSSHSNLATAFNGLTFGLSAPLCRVYYVELMFEDRMLPENDEGALKNFLEHELGFVKHGQATTGEEFVRWLEFQRENERRECAFEKHQGNSFAVYLVTVPRLAGGSVGEVEAEGGAAGVLKRRAEKRYRALDVADNVIMLGGRFHNSVWSLFH
ncbi:hypothetical protein EDC01DRAFT_217452 [Geopyxis carbonaria]|nr:hypothetical protein EDC01DRAFT_217452 [Geopyxis carbonaria]